MWATVFEMAGDLTDPPPPLGIKVCVPKRLVKKGLRFQCLYLNLCRYCGFCIARICLSKALQWVFFVQILRYKWSTTNTEVTRSMYYGLMFINK